MLEHHLFIPVILKSELVWQFEEEAKLRRLETLNKLVRSCTTSTRVTFHINSSWRLRREESGIPIIRTTSSDDMNGSGHLCAFSQQQQQHHPSPTHPPTHPCHNTDLRR